MYLASLKGQKMRERDLKTIIKEIIEKKTVQG